MFEAVIALCLLAAPETCRDALLPGFEAATLEGCATLLAEAPPDLAERFPDLSTGTPTCQPAGLAAEVSDAGPGVFVHLGRISDAAPGNAGDVANSGFVIGNTSVAVIDSGGSRLAGEALWRAIRARTALPVSHVILTHMHPDHVLGASVFAEAGAEVVGHAGLPRALADRAETYLANFGARIGAPAFLGTRIVLPDRAVAEPAEIDLGGRTLRLAPWPNAHTATDLTVGDPASGILFTGDLVFDIHTPSLDGSVLGWQAVLGEMQALPYARIVPGHGGPVLDWPQGAENLARYLGVLVADTRAAIAGGLSLGEAAETVARSEAGHWQLFELFNPRNATVAFTELEWE